MVTMCMEYCFLLQDNCPDVQNVNQDPFACQEPTGIKKHSTAVHLSISKFNCFVPYTVTCM